jgi:hypothetical protein
MVSADPVICNVAGAAISAIINNTHPSLLWVKYDDQKRVYQYFLLDILWRRKLAEAFDGFPHAVAGRHLVTRSNVCRNDFVWLKQ